MFEKVIVAKTHGRFDVCCRAHDLNPHKQIWLPPDDVHRIAGLELSEDQVIIVDQPCEELQLKLDAMIRREAVT